MTDRYQITYAPMAKEDLLSIYRYIAFDLFEPKTAEKQVNRIRDCIRKLDVFPRKHQEVLWEPWSSMGMRYVSVNNYIVYYLVEDDHNLVTIIRIFYSGRYIEQIINGEDD